MAQKKPQKGIERIASLAYYLTKYKETPQFKTVDLTKLNRDAAQPPFGNAAQAVDNATKISQYLSPAGGGKKQITPRGEAVVDALPDPEKVRAALKEFPLVKGKKKSKKKQ
jgi:hypothetical protein